MRKTARLKMGVSCVAVLSNQRIVRGEEAKETLKQSPPGESVWGAASEGSKRRGDSETTLRGSSTVYSRVGNQKGSNRVAEPSRHAYALLAAPELENMRGGEQ